MTRHPLSAMFGDMPAEDLHKLAASIAAHGLAHPIVVFDGAVLDGWHRYLACRSAKVEPRCEVFEGDERAALRFVLQENAERRHMSEAQKIRLAKEVTHWQTDRAQRGGDRRSIKPPQDGLVPIAAAEVAEAAGVSVRSVERHTAVERKAPALLPHVEKGVIGLKSAEKLAATVNGEVLAAAKPEEIRSLLTTLRERPEARAAKMVAAARELREHWLALRDLDPRPFEVEAAMSDVRFALKDCRERSIGAATEEQAA
jgi:ParB-like chromosome segregation protein Spo0J